MAYLAGFQELEQRDSEGNVVKEGVVSKKSAFCTSDNAGIYDVIAENFRVIHASLSEVSQGVDASELEPKFAELRQKISDTTASLTAQIEVLETASKGMATSKSLTDAENALKEQLATAVKGLEEKLATMEQAVKDASESVDQDEFDEKIATLKEDVKTQLDDAIATMTQRLDLLEAPTADKVAEVVQAIETKANESLASLSSSVQTLETKATEIQKDVTDSVQALESKVTTSLEEINEKVKTGLESIAQSDIGNYVKSVSVQNGTLVTTNGNGDSTDLGAVSIHMLQRAKVYEQYDIVYTGHLKSYQRLDCIVGGTTAGTEIALADTETGQYIQDGEVTWIVTDVRDGALVGAVIGDVYLREGYVKANGAEVARADYPRLVAHAEKHGLWRTNDSTDLGLYGQGDGETTFVLPNWVGRFQEFAEDGAGVAVEDGLPQHAHTGTASLQRNFKNSTTSTQNNGLLDSYLSNSEARTVALSFTTNKANNAIYGKSTKVQPASIKLIPQIKY